MTCTQNATVCIESGHIFVIVIHCTIRHNVRNNELLLPRFIYENVNIMFIDTVWWYETLFQVERVV